MPGSLTAVTVAVPSLPAYNTYDPAQSFPGPANDRPLDRRHPLDEQDTAPSAGIAHGLTSAFLPFSDVYARSTSRPSTPVSFHLT